MPQHTIRQGECIESIAVDYGLSWQTIWDHPQNAALRGLRKTPTILLAGDIVFVPDKVVKWVACRTGALHRFRRNGVPSELNVQFFHGSTPRADEEYRLQIGGSVENGRTDGDGWIHKKIMPTVRTVQVTFVDDLLPAAYTLQVGHLDPVDSPSGLRQRLQSLGYLRAADGEPSDAVVKQALHSFQIDHEVPTTNAADSRTCQKLIEMYGC